VRCRDGSLASSHHWARQIGALGHEVRLIAPIYVKPFVKRNKNDAADAEAIAEAASRPTMRFVAVKSAEKQASGMAFKTRDLLVRQRTQAINALRGHMAEYGVVAPNGPVHIERLAEALQDGGGLPAPVVALSQMLLAHIAALSEQIGLLDQELREHASRSNRQTANDNS
jgi:transposase